MRMRLMITAALLVAAGGLASCGDDEDSTWGAQNQPSSLETSGDTGEDGGSGDDDGSSDGEGSAEDVDEDGFGDYEVSSTSGANVLLHVTEESESSDLIERTERLREAADVGPVHWLKAEVTGAGPDTFRVRSCGFTVTTQDGQAIDGDCSQDTTISLDWLSNMDTERAMDLGLTDIVDEWYERSSDEYAEGETGSFYVMFEEPIDSVDKITAQDKLNVDEEELQPVG